MCSFRSEHPGRTFGWPPLTRSVDFHLATGDDLQTCNGPPAETTGPAIDSRPQSSPVFRCVVVRHKPQSRTAVSRCSHRGASLRGAPASQRAYHPADAEVRLKACTRTRLGSWRAHHARSPTIAQGALSRQSDSQDRRGFDAMFRRLDFAGVEPVLLSHGLYCPPTARPLATVWLTPLSATCAAECALLSGPYGGNPSCELSKPGLNLIAESCYPDKHHDRNCGDH
jgi:hypothetical protein